jgi:DNA mismatch repair protein MutS2
MKNFLLHSNKQTLFLIDEFGTGTEPRFGGAIAESILEELYAQKAFGVITTHYDNIKNFAVKNQNVINGAMKFDERNLEPMYELEIGKPGSSFAIEVANKMGIPPAVLEKAKSKIGKERVNYDKLLNQLGKEKRELESKLKEVLKKEGNLEKSAQDYDDLNEFLKTQKKQIIIEAKQEAKSIVKEANKRVEQAIREIKESQAEKEKTKRARKQLTDFEEKLAVPKDVEQKAVKPVKESFQNVEGKIKVGDYVKIKGQETIGEVLSVGQKEAEISLGELKSKIKLNRLERMSKTSIKKEKKKSYSGGSTGMMERSSNFKHQIDVRGLRADDAIPVVDRFIDDALVLGYNEVSILHGRGDGILRRFIRDYLKQYNYVKKMVNEHEERGGDGITLVTLS